MTVRDNFYAVRIPFNRDLKAFIQKWYGYEDDFILKVDYATFIGRTARLMLLDEPKNSNRSQGANEVDLKLLIPKGKFFDPRRISDFQSVIYGWLIEQIIAVVQARKDLKGLTQGKRCVVEYYITHFNLQNTTIDALEKAIQRIKNSRQTPRFNTR